MELSRFAPAYVAEENLSMNRFEAGLNPDLKGRMLVRHCTSYKDMYDTAVNGERAMKEIIIPSNRIRGRERISLTTPILITSNILLNLE